MNDQKANLFVVGAMRAGTTSFMRTIGEHPEIYVSPIKEPHFFAKDLPKEYYKPSRFFSIDSYFKKDFPKPLHIAQIRNQTQYERLFSLASTEKYRSEGSTAYLHEPHAAHAIYTYNPNSQIIILLRDPLQRAYSHYRMDVGLGREKRQFETIMIEQLQQFKEGILPWYSYMNMSCYDDAVIRFQHTFERVFIFSFDEMIMDTSSFLLDFFGKLEINFYSIKKLEKSNSAGIPKFSWSPHFLGQQLIKNSLSKVFPENIKSTIKKLLIKEHSNSLPLNPRTLEELKQFFSESSKVYYNLSIS